jgi:hypothetical protein
MRRGVEEVFPLSQGLLDELIPVENVSFPSGATKAVDSTN